MSQNSEFVSTPSAVFLSIRFILKIKTIERDHLENAGSTYQMIKISA